MLSLALVVRLFAWKFYKGAQAHEKVDLSNIAASIFILFTGVVFVMKKRAQGKAVSRSGIDVPVILFFMSALVSLGYSADQFISLKAVFILCSYLFFFYILNDSLSSIFRVRLFIMFLIACGFVSALAGIKEYIYFLIRDPASTQGILENVDKSMLYVLLSRRVVSFFGWPNVLAGFFMLVIPPSVTFVFLFRKRWQKICMFLIALTLIVAMAFTFSVAGWASLFIAALICFLCFRKFVDGKGNGHEKNRNAFKHRLIIVSVAATVCLLSFFIISKRSSFSSLNSFGPRMQYLHSVGSLINEHPFAGNGFNTFQVANRRFIYFEDGYSSFAHNSYLQVWSESGIVGFLALLAIVYVVLKMGGRAFNLCRHQGDRVLLAGLLCGVAAFAIHNIFSFTMLKPNISFFWWAQLAVICALIRNISAVGKKDAVDGGIQRQKVFQWTAAAFSLAAILLIIFLSARIYSGEVYYYKGIRMFRRGDTEAALNLFRKAKAINPLDGRFSSAIGQVCLDLYAAKKNTVYLEIARKEIEIAIRKKPLVYDNYLYLSRIWASLGDRGKAKEYYFKALELAPYIKNSLKTRRK